MTNMQVVCNGLVLLPKQVMCIWLPYDGSVYAELLLPGWLLNGLLEQQACDCVTIIVTRNGDNIIAKGTLRLQIGNVSRVSNRKVYQCQFAGEVNTLGPQKYSLEGITNALEKIANTLEKIAVKVYEGDQ